jgi:hypothetical protein
MLEQLRKFITALVFTLFGLIGPAWAASPQPTQVKAEAPDSYVVVKGDTLWGISGRFTNDPWRWPELWDLNKDQIKNPHLIYPGDVIRLDRLSGRLSIAGGSKDPNRLSPRIRDEGTTDQPIPSIPPSIIEPFLTRPLLVEPGGLDKAPTIVDTEGGRVALAAGNRAYVRGLGDASTSSWYVYRQGDALVDPDSNLTLGFEAKYLGTADVIAKGEVATIELTHTVQEVAKGDKLIAVGKPQPVTYAPHAPATFIKGRILAIHSAGGRFAEAGQGAIVALNRGQADGIEMGHVLALYSQSRAVKVADGGTVHTPEERYGLVFVFRVFERVSYAIVMKIGRPVNTLDIVQTP